VSLAAFTRGHAIVIETAFSVDADADGHSGNIVGLHQWPHGIVDSAGNSSVGCAIDSAAADCGAAGKYRQQPRTGV
jgi:hypothetical protein